MSIQIHQEETPLAFAEDFYLAAWILFSCGRLGLDDSFTATVSSVAAHSHFQLYLKGICKNLT